MTDSVIAEQSQKDAETEAAEHARLYGDLPVIDKARCYNPACGKMFEPYTNEWFCSIPCYEAYPADRWPKRR